MALYFAFVGHYTYTLLLPAIIGLPLQIAVFALDNYSAIFLPIYSYFIALWAIVMLEFWKRRESRLAMEWGMSDFDSRDLDRSEFQGKPIISFVDGSPIRYFPQKTRQIYTIQSGLATFALILLVLGNIIVISNSANIII